MWSDNAVLKIWNTKLIKQDKYLGFSSLYTETRIPLEIGSVLKVAPLVCDELWCKLMKLRLVKTVFWRVLYREPFSACEGLEITMVENLKRSRKFWQW